MLKPIGIFDSGVGGLSVLRRLIEHMPNQSFVYFGDCINAPYGGRPVNELLQLSLEGLGFLMRFDLSCIVLACGSVSANCAAALRQQISLPIFDMVAPNMAALASSSRPMGFIATAATINSGTYRLEYAKACPSFVPLIEGGLHNSPAAYQAAKDELASLVSSPIEALVCGCTHYPFMEPAIRAAFTESGKAIDILDPANWLAKDLSTRFTIETDASPTYRFYTSAYPERLGGLLNTFLPNQKIETIGEL